MDAERTTVVQFLRERSMDVIKSWRTILRLSIAPALAWWLSLQLFGHGQAFFAPIAAILTLTVGVGERVSIVMEIVLGAAVGILVGELLILSIGRGTWQLMLVIALAIASARFLRLPGMATTQAVITTVLLVAIVPAPGITDPALTRFGDALLGGLVGLAAIIIIPANPVREMDRGIQNLFDEIASILHKIAGALRTSDSAIADEALEQSRATQPMVDRMGTMADRVTEMAKLSPFRWRQRSSVVKRTDALTELDHAVRNVRVLARRVAAMIRAHEPVPPGLADDLDRLARLASTDPENIAELTAVARHAIGVASENLTINTGAIASQIRAIVADILLAAGRKHTELDDTLDVD